MFTPETCTRIQAFFVLISFRISTVIILPVASNSWNSRTGTKSKRRGREGGEFGQRGFKALLQVHNPCILRAGILKMGRGYELGLSTTRERSGSLIYCGSSPLVEAGLMRSNGQGWGSNEEAIYYPLRSRLHDPECG